jgi:ribosomal-protein-alanine N-acetyltransferase
MALERRTASAPHWAESDYEMAVEMDPNSALRRCLLVAEQETGDQRLDVIGFVIGKAIGTGLEAMAELESIVVAEQARRSGVGRSLCAAVIQWCRELKITHVKLEVRPSNSGAIALYTNIGFVPIGLRTRYYREPEEDAVLMQVVVFPSEGDGFQPR